MELPGSFLSPSSKNKKHLPQKSFLYYRKWNVLALRLKNFFYFRKSNFLALRLKNSLYFWNWNYLASYFSYSSEGNFWSSKNFKKPTPKIFFIFREMELSSFKLKKLLFSGGNLQNPKNKQKVRSEGTSYISTKKVLLTFRNDCTKNFSIFRTETCQLLFDVSAIL